MSLTPVEIRHVKLGRRLGGYDRPATDALLVRIAESFEDVWRERADLRDEIERLEGELARFRELEVLLRNTLVSAERSADELRAQAHREADVILDEARVRAREIGGGAESERERVRADIRRLKNVEAQMRAEYRAFLATALDRLEGDTEERETPGQAA
ncbi:MAG TPA: DivIVA domain-containing protein [Gaiellaceae bacterium]|jgi:cell division initiation protein|nr:DivIVA domain-containing protein [Gaiellaceae bacterium]